MASYAENVSIWWHHHDEIQTTVITNRQSTKLFTGTFSFWLLICIVNTETYLCGIFMSVNCRIYLKMSTLRLSHQCWPCTLSATVSEMLSILLRWNQHSFVKMIPRDFNRIFIFSFSYDQLKYKTCHWLSSLKTYLKHPPNCIILASLS